MSYLFQFSFDYVTNNIFGSVREFKALDSLGSILEG